MPQVTSARAARSASDGATVLRPAAWAGREPARASVAVLLFGADSAEEAETRSRLLRTIVPQAMILPCGGAEMDRSTRTRRTFAETSADIYVLADDLGDPLGIGRAIAAVENDEKDLVAVTALELTGDAPADPADRLLGLVLDYLFGCGRRHIASPTRVCSRRFAQSYSGDATPLDLTLHALRLRMPVGEVASLGPAVRPTAASGRRGLSGWMRLGGFVVRLFAEERPRRTFGLVGIGSMAAGIATAIPALRMHDSEAMLPSGLAAAASCALTAIGLGLILSGLLLDTLAKARQDVCRLSYLAIPRRDAADRQSSVS